MATNKYASLNTLREFLENLKTTFANISHKHTVSELTDYKVDSELSATSTNPVQNKVINEEFDAMADALGALELAIDGKANEGHNHDDRYYTEEEVDAKISNVNTSITNITNGNIKVANAAHADNADSATTANTANTATKATQDASGNVITSTYETKVDAQTKFDTANGYTDESIAFLAEEFGQLIKEMYGDDFVDRPVIRDIATDEATKVKNDLLNGAGGAYDTLKELGDLIDDNHDAIDALEKVAANKADKDHNHDTVYETKDDAQAKYDETIGAIDELAAGFGEVIYEMYGDDWDTVETTGVFLTIREISADEASSKMNSTNPEGTGSFSMDRKNGTTVGQHSATFGKNCEASGDYTYADGYSNTASGDNSHAGGEFSVASAYCAHAFGDSVKASGEASYAEGRDTIASAEYSHAEGYGTIANGINQHVQGKYNIADVKSLHIVGNGESDTERSNAHTLASDGTAWFAGDVYVGSTSGVNKDEGSKRLITADDVATPDWNAPEGAPGYIKNKTHGLEKGAVLVEETEFVAGIIDSGLGYYTLPSFAIVPGQSYIVNFDGVEYLCEASAYNFAGVNSVCIGDYLQTYYQHDSANAEVPFSICLRYTGDTTDIYTVHKYYPNDKQQENLLNTHTVSVYEAAVKQLNPKFITDMYYSEVLDEVGEYILPDTELVYDEDGQWFILPTAATVSLKAGETYFVNYNGTQYKCVAEDYTEEGLSFTVLGNMEDTGEPFVIMCGSGLVIAFGISFVLSTLDDAESVTLSIAKAKEEIHYIDPKYIKNMYYGGDGEVIFDNYTVTAIMSDGDTCTGVLNVPAELIVGTEYEVSIDGVLYTSTAVSVQLGDMPLVILGNLGHIFGDEELDTGEPFGFMVVTPELAPILGTGDANLIVVWTTGNTDMVFSISTKGEEIHKIDNKYIDAEWMATSKMEKGQAIFEDKTFPLEEDGGIVDASDSNWELEIGATYSVVFDGVEYFCECLDTLSAIGEPGGMILGNSEFAIQTGDNGMPFVIVYDPQNAYGVIINLYNPEAISCTISIYKVNEVVNKLPNKFIDAEWMATYIKAAGSAIVEEAEFTLDENGECMLYNVVELVEGKEYIVKYNGVEYNCTCVLYSNLGVNMLMLGNYPSLLGTGNNGMPFIFATATIDGVLIGSIVPIDGSESFTFGLYEVDEAPNKLPAKFLPDGLGTVVEAISDETIDAICGV